MIVRVEAVKGKIIISEITEFGEILRTLEYSGDIYTVQFTSESPNLNYREFRVFRKENHDPSGAVLYSCPESLVIWHKEDEKCDSKN